MNHGLKEQIVKAVADTGVIDGYATSEYNNETLKAELAHGTYDRDIADNDELVGLLGDLLNNGSGRPHDDIHWGITTLEECYSNYDHRVNLENAIRTLQSVYEKTLNNVSISSLITSVVVKRVPISTDMLTFLTLFKDNIEKRFKYPDTFVPTEVMPTEVSSNRPRVFIFTTSLVDWEDMSVDDEIVITTRLYGVKQTLALLISFLGLLHA